MNNTKSLFTLLSLVILSGAFVSAENAFATAPAIATAEHTDIDETLVTFTIAVDGILDITKWTVGGNPIIHINGTSGAFSDSTVNGTAANDITITLTHLPIDTDDQRVVAYTGSTLVETGGTDPLSNTASVTAADGIAPTLDSVETGPDANQITYTFSEAMDTTGSIVAGDFAAVAGNNPDGAIPLVIINTDVTVTFDGNFLANYIETPAERFTTSAAVDDAATSPNSLTQGIGDTIIAITDGVAPAFTAERTDVNTFKLTFTEPVTGSASGASNAFTVVGASSVAYPAILTPSSTLILTTTGLSGTHQTPTVGYVDALGDFVDVSSNEIDEKKSAVAVDKVAPIILSAKTNLAGSIVYTFSEDIDASTVASTDFASLNTKGPSTAVPDPANAAIIVVTYSGNPFAPTFTDPPDERFALSSTVSDNFGNVLSHGDPGTTIAITDGSIPTFTAERTGLNAITLTFSEPVSGSFSTNSFTISDGGTLVSQPAIVTNNKVILVISGIPGTDKTPTVTYVASNGNIEDAGFNEINDGESAIAADKVGPIITLSGLNPQSVEFGAGYVDAGATTDDGSLVIVTTSGFIDAVGGPYPIYYNSADSDGNAATTVTRNVFVIDTVPPLPTISSSVGINGTITNTSPVTFTVDFGEFVTSFVTSKLIVSGDVTGSITTPTVTPTGSSQTYTFDVTYITDEVITVNLNSGAGVDSGLNPSAAAGPFVITFDQTDPISPTVPNMIDASDTGSDYTDNITSNTTPIFNGTGTLPGDYVVLVEETAPGVYSELNRIQVPPSGTWSLAPSIALGVGDHKIAAYSFDAAGNRVSETLSLDITIQTASASSISFSSILSSPTAVDPLQFTISLNGDVDENTVTSSAFNLSSGTISSISSPGPGIFDLIVTGSDNDAVFIINNIAGVILDKTGLPIPVVQFSITVDRVSPTPKSIIVNTLNQIVITFDEPVSLSGFINSDFVIGGTINTITVTSHALSSSGLVLTLDIDRVFHSGDTPTLTYTAITGLIDNAFNPAVISNYPFTHNTSNVQPNLSTIGDKSVQETRTLTFTAIGSDANLSDTLTYSATLSSGALLPTGASINPSTGTFTWTPTKSQEGVYVITITVTDDGAPLNLDVSETITITVTNKSSSNSNEHKTKPTFGVDHKTFKQVVDNGFTFNEKSFKITDNFWTPFDKQTIHIGEFDSFSAKVFAQKQLRVQEFLFGIPATGQAQDAELGIEVFYTYSGEIDSVNVVQKTDIVDADSISVLHEKTKCLPNDQKESCDVTYLHMKFLEPLQHDVMAIKAIDYKNRYQITYLNDGFDISGDSLNPMNTKMIQGTEKYEGLIKITQSAKYSNLWIADDGRIFESNEYGTLTWINQTFKSSPSLGEPTNRSHSEFSTYKQAQVDRAITELLSICPTCLDTFTDFEDSWSHTLPTTYDSKYDDPEILKTLAAEEARAQVLMDKIFKTLYPSKVFN